MANPSATPGEATSRSWEFKSGVTVRSPVLEDLGTLIQVGLDSGASNLSRTEVEYVPTGPGSTIANSYTAGNSRPPVEQVLLPSATLEVEARGSTPAEAVARGAKTTAKVEQALKNKLPAKGSISITEFTVNHVDPAQPNASTGYQPRPTRRIYSAHTNVSLKTADLEALGAIIEAGMAIGATQLNSVSFTLSADATVRKAAIEKASADAIEKAQSLASSMGVKLGKLLQTSISTQTRPQVIYGASFGRGTMMISDGGGNSLRSHEMPALPQEVGLTADVNAVYEIQ